MSFYFILKNWGLFHKNFIFFIIKKCKILKIKKKKSVFDLYLGMSLKEKIKEKETLKFEWRYRYSLHCKYLKQKILVPQLNSVLKIYVYLTKEKGGKSGRSLINFNSTSSQLCFLKILFHFFFFQVLCILPLIILFN